MIYLGWLHKEKSGADGERESIPVSVENFLCFSMELKINILIK